jgi:hypothetical protein
MNVYHGTRTEHGVAVVIEDNGECRSLDPGHDLRSHSLSAFEWSYSRSGPAQLALALAPDVLGDNDKAQDICQRLKFKLIGGLPKEGWVLTEGRIRVAIDSIERERAPVR